MSDHWPPTITRDHSTATDTADARLILKAIGGDLDALIIALEALEIPLRHDLALDALRELQTRRAEEHEYAAEICHQMRQIMALERERDELLRAFDLLSQGGYRITYSGKPEGGTDV